MLSKTLQEKLNRVVPKEKQKDFIESAVQEKLDRLFPSDSPVLEAYVDGGSRGNPGPAGGGFAVYQNGKKWMEGSEFFGEKTNNQAEYLALRMALREVYDRCPEARLRCFMDSQLVVEQMNGNYKVKSENVRPLFLEVQRIAGQFKSFEITHIDRGQNKRADLLANEAMDKGK